tara:strand:- start:1238 stop:1708 length:471 start_codon:yes stop_codon:yes gene_type:complete
MEITVTSTTETTKTAEEAEVTSTEAKTPLEIISEEYEGAPSVETMTSWKATYGALHAFAPDNETIFLFRPLKRIEHKNITQDIRQLSESNAAQANPLIVEDALHEKVLQACVLHPQVGLETFTNSDAGVIPTIFNLVMEHSKFISPEKAMASCYKL